MRRRYRYPGRSAGTGFTVFIIVIILAVAVGYAGTKYIVYPYLLGNGAATEPKDQGGAGSDQTGGVDPNTSLPSVIIDQQNVQNQQPNAQTPQQSQGSSENSGASQTINSAKGPFSVQFGSFSTKVGADEMSTALTGKGIYSYVYESNGSYKVLGLPYESEAKAKEAAAVVSAVVSDVFVVNLSNLIQ
ncbi:hypothetical protein FRZ06_05940 [Anoxybacterium hadale]|uniref:Uncharacterized protein n=1 Tax=Anoxybacterium hadale TaxID=3408580 RepID=A0ACD1A906_9FIRM|nr:hypothetical protein FRZ06_05940 [Clostridiales bacterium]